MQAVKITMLYCPKCQQTYEEGVQRFCSNEGERLLPVQSSGKSAKQTGGVFTSILNRRTGEADDKFSSPAGFPKTQSSKFSSSRFRPPTDSKIFISEENIELELEPQVTKPFTPIFKLDENLTSLEHIGENETEAIERADLTTDYPETFIGQIIHDRYEIVEEIERDETGIAYLAEDTIVAEQKVVVKIMTNEESDDSFADNIFAEERNSFSHLNHSNIVKVIESGELTGGKSYLVTEYVEGKSVKNYLRENGEFNALRTARIIRQAADALEEAHQIGVLHRNIKPDNIILTVDENGAERIKLTNFNFSKEKLNEENLLYKSPEQVEGKVANFTSDGYSLAVVAYQMLTNRLPFNALSVGDLLKLQREGLTLRPSDLRADLSSTIDEVLEKALAFNAFDRYAKVRDFGDEFFSEIIINAPLETEETEEAETISDVIVEEKPSVEPSLVAEELTSKVIPDAEIQEGIFLEEDEDLIRSVKATEDLAWEKRSPKPLDKANPNRSTASLIGVAALLVVLFGVWYYFINRPSEPTFVEPPTEIANQNAPTVENPIPANTAQNVAPTPDDIDQIPLPRTISQPPDTEYFQNSKEDLKGEAMKNFLGFSLYYPKDWKRNEAKNNFLDISKTGKDELPVEQMLVSYYNSKGTFKADEGNFPAQVKETNATLKKLLPDYKVISEGRKTVNNGWQAYEIKFQGTGKAANGDKITLWGKRLFIPTAIRGMKNGYVITMLATSLSKEVKSVNDVGVKGDLATVLETFEPNQNF